jgi:hypothetical protein
MALGRLRRPGPGDTRSAGAVQRMLRAEAFSRLAEVTAAASSRAGRTVHGIQDHIGNRFWARSDVGSSDDEQVGSLGLTRGRCAGGSRRTVSPSTVLRARRVFL